MPKEYIEREAVLNELQEELEFNTPMYTAEQNEYVNRGLKIAVKDIKKAPTADVVEVKHGEWTEGKIFCIWQCSLCHFWIDVLQGTAEMNYCPNCGAKMDGERRTK